MMIRHGSRRRTLLFACLGLTLLFGIVGCGKPNPLNRQAISGLVTLDGQPVNVGTIRFAPQVPKGVASGGPIREGQFSIRAPEGLPPGKYVVRIYATAQDDSPVAEDAPPGLAAQRPGIDLIPPQYNVRTGLSCEIVEDAANELTFELTTDR